MSRPGFLLSVTGPAVVLALLIQPGVRHVADRLTAPTGSVAAVVSQDVADLRGVPATANRVHVASVPSAGPRPAPVTPALGRTASDKEMPRMRKPLQEGCERSISSLAGPEARRMVAGRCMT